jgi:hypothetical protein
LLTKTLLVFKAESIKIISGHKPKSFDFPTQSISTFKVVRKSSWNKEVEIEKRLKNKSRLFVICQLLIGLLFPLGDPAGQIFSRGLIELS